MSSQGGLSVKLSVFIQNQLSFTKTYKKGINKGEEFFSSSWQNQEDKVYINS